MIRRPPRSTQGVSSAASDVYKRQLLGFAIPLIILGFIAPGIGSIGRGAGKLLGKAVALSLIHISEPTRPY